MPVIQTCINLKKQFCHLKNHMTGKKAKPFFQLNKSYEVSGTEIKIPEDLEFVTHAFSSH